MTEAIFCIVYIYYRTYIYIAYNIIILYVYIPVLIVSYPSGPEWFILKIIFLSSIKCACECLLCPHGSLQIQLDHCSSRFLTCGLMSYIAVLWICSFSKIVSVIHNWIINKLCPYTASLVLIVSYQCEAQLFLSLMVILRQIELWVAIEVLVYLHKCHTNHLWHLAVYCTSGKNSWGPIFADRLTSKVFSFLFLDSPSP